MTVIPHFRPMARVVGIFLYDDFQLLDAAGPISAFEIAGRMAPEAYSLTIVSVIGGTVRSSSGVTLDSISAESASAPDTLVVVGGEGSRAAMHCAGSLAYLRGRGEQIRRMCSVCSGAFVLAAAGLLD